VEKRDGHYLLILESDESCDDETVIADGTNVLHQMVHYAEGWTQLSSAKD
jgi:hypothetical protein